MAFGKNITWKKGKWKQYYLPFNIEVVEKNIKWGLEGEKYLGKIKI